MRFRVERDSLADAVAWAARTLPSRPPNPMLAGLLIEADPSTDQGLVLSSYDYEVSSRVSAAADIGEPGRVLVSGRLLADIAKSLPAQPVSVAIDGTRLSLACGRASFTLPTLPVEDYPSLPAMPEPLGVIDGAAFAAAVAQVAVAAGRDDTLPSLTGIRVEVDGEMVTMAATDRYRLAVREFAWTPQATAKDLALLIPARTLAETAKSLASAKSVRIAVASGGSGEGLVGFEGDGRRTTSRLVDHDFPKYRSLLPDTSATTADVITGDLVEAVKRVALVAERNTPVLLTFANDELMLKAGAGDDAKAVEVLECSIDGDAIEIAFNPQFLLDGLGAVDSPVTRMLFTVAQKPAVMVGVDDGQVRAGYRYLLMPVRLSGATG